MSTSSSADKPRPALDFLLKWFPGTALAAALVLHALVGWGWGPLQQLDAWIHDQRLQAFASRTRDERIAIVDIDERSLAAVGRWPWGRDRLADLVRRVFDQQGAAIVGLDLILAEPDTSSGLPVLEQWAAGPLAGDPAYRAALESRRVELDRDGQLATVIATHPVVLGFHVTRGAHAIRSGTLPPPVMPPDAVEGLPRFHGYGASLDRLSKPAAGGGFLEAWVDPDGIRRQAPLLVQIDGQIHGSMALALARAQTGGGTWKAEPATGPLQALVLDGPRGRLRVPVGPDAGIVLPYAGPLGWARLHSAIDILDGKLPAQSLRGRIVLVGTSVPGLADLRPTPVNANLPGVQTHATLLGALLDERVPHVPAWSRPVEALFLLALTGCMWPLARLSLRTAAVWALVAVVSLVAANAWAWDARHWALPLASSLLLVMGLFGWRVVHGLVWEQRERRRIETLFGQYVPPELVARMSRDAAHYDMQGRSAELTVLFADLRGFTRLSESLPPAELAELMNDFFSAMAEIVRQHKGTLDKYIGDSVMAFWGAPVADPAHARHAVAAALSMQAALPGLNQRFAQRGWPALALSIGINSGTMVVGDLGSRHRRAYTVMGDAVNVASRLEELTSSFGVDILIGEETQARLPPGAARPLGSARLRGRQAAVMLHTPIPGAPG